MDSIELTFSDLKSLMQQKLARGEGVSVSSGPNLASALTSFLRERRIPPESAVGSVFRASFYDHIRAHVAAMRSEGRSNAYIANRRSLLALWRRCVIEQDRHCAVRLHQATPFQQALLDVVSKNFTRKGLAKASGMPLATLRRWLDGRLPNARSAHYIPRLERLIGLTPGSLTELLPTQVHSGHSERPVQTIAYRARLKEQREEQRREQGMQAYVARTPTPRLRQEWSDFIQYKVSELAVDDDADDNMGKTLKRSTNGRWSSTIEAVVRQRPSTWHCFYKGRYVPAAGIRWSFTWQFMSWLMLDVAKGGKGMAPDAAQTLAHLARRGLLREFVEWRRERSGGIAHSGIDAFLMYASSLCNPRTGYLTQSWRRFAEVAGVNTEAAWIERCEATYESIVKLRSELSDDAAPSRHSFEPIQRVLALSNPLDAIADMVVRMDAAKPNSGGTREAVWARDRLLVTLLASNPLRDKNLRMMTFKPDGTGHLRRGADGGWYIFIPRRELKNFKGAARDRDYHMRVRPEVWPYIDRYLNRYRPVLQKTESALLFLSERSGGPMSETTLRRRFEFLTRRYLHECVGVGPHSMRHIVATAILKQSPNDWNAAAWALHDREETVRKHYAHLAQHDADKWLSKAMDKPFGRM